ncbi:MAG TPA: UdgX family uracil-DNA binding protein [Candidatus Sulfotelmatobacter sp.]|nr:UdgX family uracil-DNA binding protein [Candidatus Sulfotelmatobacter sp.]
MPALREAAAGCHGCDLYRHATQTVFGEGPLHATAMLIGEQPGDREDREGHPFVGPAGKLLHEALAEAGIDPARVYITNAVKHFAFVERGKRRIHRAPKRTEVRACLPWLEAELRLIQPGVVVALGATAAQALLGPKFRVTEERGRLVTSELAPRVVATVHPASILRAIDEDARRAARAEFVDDLRTVAGLLAQTAGR